MLQDVCTVSQNVGISRCQRHLRRGIGKYRLVAHRVTFIVPGMNSAIQDLDRVISQVVKRPAKPSGAAAALVIISNDPGDFIQSQHAGKICQTLFRREQARRGLGARIQQRIFKVHGARNMKLGIGL